MVEALESSQDSISFRHPDIGEPIEVTRKTDARPAIEVGVVVRADLGDDPKTIVQLEDGTYITGAEISGFEPVTQGSYFGKHTKVSLSGSTREPIDGIVVRHDNEEPHIMLIALNNGRVVYDYEYHYSPPV